MTPGIVAGIVRPMCPAIIARADSPARNVPYANTRLTISFAWVDHPGSRPPFTLLLPTPTA
jgi:hypothetical protein